MAESQVTTDSPNRPRTLSISKDESSNFVNELPTSDLLPIVDQNTIDVDQNQNVIQSKHETPEMESETPENIQVDNQDIDMMHEAGILHRSQDMQNSLPQTTDLQTVENFNQIARNLDERVQHQQNLEILQNIQNQQIQNQQLQNQDFQNHQNLQNFQNQQNFSQLPQAQISCETTRNFNIQAAIDSASNPALSPPQPHHHQLYAHFQTAPTTPNFHSMHFDNQAAQVQNFRFTDPQFVYQNQRYLYQHHHMAAFKLSVEKYFITIK